MLIDARSAGDTVTSSVLKDVDVTLGLEWAIGTVHSRNGPRVAPSMMVLAKLTYNELAIIFAH
jgi:hypothetical protein